MRGAFTGAVGSRQGRIEQADKGTLFLDEIGTMPSSLQMKMLRVLQEREFERIGDARTVKVDVRVVAATNADLARMVKEGSFREDLFYRLNVVPVQLPPLRERSEDIPLLVARFIDKHQPGGEGKEPVVVAQEAMRRLMAFEWPGNVRQLENVVERALALGGGRRPMDVDDLPPEMRAEAPPVSYVPRLSEEGVDLPHLVSRVRTAADRSGAGAHRGQSRRRRASAQFEADDARREAERLGARGRGGDRSHEALRRVHLLIGKDRHVRRVSEQQVDGSATAGRRPAMECTTARLRPPIATIQMRVLLNRKGNDSVRRRQRRLGRIVHGHHPVLVLQRGMSGKERRDVAVLADTEDGEIQRLPVQLAIEDVVVVDRRLFQVELRRRHREGPRRARLQRI